MNKLWYLSQISIFEEMPLEEMREIDPLDTIHHLNRITKNTLVQTPESAREGLYFVKEGKRSISFPHWAPNSASIKTDMR
ncbi:hypothetical protein ACIFOT_00810 [Neobacillus sp. NRS-1170]|uniref:hypothetical protein n=1 Tax=Neobacillus sp. NRS-1170 TaxID=3233898 RepID=UPI003D2D597A